MIAHSSGLRLTQADSSIEAATSGAYQSEARIRHSRMTHSPRSHATVFQVMTSGTAPLAARSCQIPSATR